MVKTILSILSLLVASTALAAPAQVLIIRHGEKPDSGEDLSPAGYARAQALVSYFENTAAVTQYGTPVAIYAMGYDSKSKSHREVETVTPLAKALGLPIHDDYTRKQFEPMTQEVLNTAEYDGRMVLICWDHAVIPSIAQDFGVKDAPSTWSDDDFWSVWRLDFTGDQVSSFDVFSQSLMPGDPQN